MKSTYQIIPTFIVIALCLSSCDGTSQQGLSKEIETRDKKAENQEQTTQVPKPLELVMKENPYVFVREVDTINTPLIANVSDLMGCESSPSLPTGFILSNDCKLSGAPTNVSTLTQHHIRASKGVTHFEGILNLKVVDQYPRFLVDKVFFTENETILQPIELVDQITTQCTASEQLPLGVRLGSDCKLTGTPQEAVFYKLYNITASNSGGTNEQSIRISTAPGTWNLLSDSNGSNTHGVYGQKGVEAPDNHPGSRMGSASWVDSLGNFWIFGGFGYAEEGPAGYLSDSWKHNGSNWTWMSGSKDINEPPVWNTRGLPDGLSKPGARAFAAYATSTDGSLLLFGGDENSHYADTWKFDGRSWTWLAGPSGINEQTPYYYVPEFDENSPSSPNNHPGALFRPAFSSDELGNLWLFGGINGAEFQDSIWKFDGVSWTPFFRGVEPHSLPSYNTNANPGGRIGSSMSVFPNETIIIHGGEIINGKHPDDTWVYSENTWEFVAGKEAESSQPFSMPARCGEPGLFSNLNSPGSTLHNPMISTGDSSFVSTSNLAFGLFEFNGNQWRCLRFFEGTPPVAPSSYSGPSNIRSYTGTKNPFNHGILLFGGQQGNGEQSDLWNFYISE